MKKVGVTGGMGFIGRYTVEYLQTAGYEPVIFDHHRRAPGEYPSDVEVFMGDVRDEVAMTEFAAHVDGMIHLAAVLGTQETVFNPRPAASSNLEGGLNFLEACAQYDLPGVYIAVGNHWFNNPYSITKNMIERFCHMFNADRGGRFNIVRAVNAYGPRQLAAAPFGHGKVRKITPAFICRALCGMPIEVYGDGSQVSDMVYVGDVARALVRALERAEQGRTFDHAIEVGSATHTTVRTVAHHVIDLAAQKGYDRVDIAELPMRPGEKKGEAVTADITTLPLVGMDAGSLTPLRVGLNATMDYFIETKGTAWHHPR